MSSFKSWNEFLKSSLPHSTKVNYLKSSNLQLKSPGIERQLVWMSLVEPSFAKEASDFFSTARADKSIVLADGLAARIREDLAKNAMFYSYQDSNPTILLIMAVFFKRNPKIVYKAGMISLLHVVLKMYQSESDTFIVFAHLIEKIYPKDFFTGEENSASFYSELKCFSMLVEKMRPKILKCLSFNCDEKNLQKFAFEMVIKKIAEIWYLNLFCLNFEEKDLLRVWDNAFVFGFEFVRKIALAMLSELESIFLIGVRKEIVRFDVCEKIDALAISGNAVRKMVMNDNYDVERIIKKVVKKQNYKEVDTDGVLEDSRVLEQTSEMRISKLRQSQGMIEMMKYPIEDLLRFFKYLDSHNNDTQLSRDSFCTLCQKMILLTTKASTSFFVTFDQNCTDLLSILSIKLGFAILKKGMAQKLKLIQSCLDSSQNSSIVHSKLRLVMIKLEELFDNRNNCLKKAPKGLWKRFKTLKVKDFPKIFMKHTVFKGLRECLEFLDTEDHGKYRFLRQFHFSDEMIEKFQVDELETEEDHEKPQNFQVMRMEDDGPDWVFSRDNFKRPRKKSGFNGFIDKYLNPSKGNPGNELVVRTEEVLKNDDKDDFEDNKHPNFPSEFSSVSKSDYIYEEDTQKKINDLSETPIDLPMTQPNNTSGFAYDYLKKSKSCLRTCSNKNCALM